MVKTSRLLSTLCALGLAYVAGRAAEVSLFFGLLLIAMACAIVIVGWRYAEL